ncbi:MAG TPA: cytochrome c3 family protein, partial [Longimicrobiales bacterium]
QGRLGSGFHDAQPLWLLRHGQAARQTLESCTTCHEQRDCMQCHSQTGSFQINPHGPDFDAERARDRNSRICFACHVADPIGDE